MDILMDVFGFTNSGSKVKIGEIAKHLNPIGGKVFYVNPNASGATYSFYDSNGDTIQVDDSDITTFANASYYTISGTPSADKYFVYENTTGIVSGRTWGYRGITTGATGNTIGSGKTNTATVLAITDTSPYAADSIWTLITNMRNNETNGCNDWYAGSKAEIDALKSSGISQVSSWFNNYVIWSSVEYTDHYAYYWYGIGNPAKWDYYLKSEKDRFIPFRSF